MQPRRKLENLKRSQKKWSQCSTDREKGNMEVMVWDKEERRSNTRSLCPWGRGERKQAEVMFYRLMWKNFLNPMDDWLKARTEPLNGKLSFGDIAPCFGQPGPSLLLAKDHDVAQYQVQCSKGHTKEVENHPCHFRNHLGSPEMTRAVFCCSFFPPTGLNDLSLQEQNTLL